MGLIKWVYKMNWPPQIIFLQHKYFFPIFYLNKYTIQWQWLWVHLFRVCNTNIVLTNIKMEYWRDNEDEHYLEGLSYHQPEKKERWKRKKVNSWKKPLACNFLFQPYSLFVLSILVVIKVQYQYLMGRHMIRINKNIGQEKFFHLGHFIYLFIYLYIYIHIFFLRGGEVNKNISEPGGGEGK